ncbi:hypothetical protein Tco_1066462 [Tanacetum coccineum]|uniref:Uncharacterized protein n=1 Tax=Tanacetum coccineum TaxID=301880 RepID=A0ABQ5HAM0_9ASTR
MADCESPLQSTLLLAEDIAVQFVSLTSNLTRLITRTGIHSRSAFPSIRQSGHDQASENAVSSKPGNPLDTRVPFC